MKVSKYYQVYFKKKSLFFEQRKKKTYGQQAVEQPPGQLTCV